MWNYATRGWQTAIVSTCGDAIIGMTLDGVITCWNRAAELIYGYTADEAIGRPIEFMVLDDSKDEVRDIREKILRGERVVRVETVVVTKDGRNIDISITSSPIIDESELVIGASFIARDITKQKRAERAMRKSQYILSKSQEMAHVGNWAWNMQTDEVNLSDETFRILGHSPQEIMPSLQWIRSHVHPEDQEIVDDFFGAACREGQRGSIDCRVIRPDGSVRYVNTLADRMIRDKEGRVKWVYGIVQDITDRKQTEKALEESRAQAEVYLDLMGHDITNMHQALRGNLELMEIMQESGNIDKTLIDNSIEIVERSSRIISDVKKLTQLQAGNVSLKDVDVLEILSKVKSRYSHVTKRHVTINYIPGEDCIVRAGDMLEDVFDNLVANAIQHSKGPVTIDITVDRAILEGHRYCRIAVADDGSGITPELKKKILITIKEIGVGEKTVRRGLGLCMVRTLVDSYGGRVWVEDRVKGDHTKGARFVVLLPSVE
jgi:PAS domain S-box-containing protein